MKIVIVTDAWHPQVNGVVRTLGKTQEHLTQMGHEVHMVTPESFLTIPCPSYPSIQLALFPKGKLFKIMDKISPDAVHIATEGPLGIAARRYCLKRKLQFTTSYHTQFPEYIRLRAPISPRISYAYMRWFHRKAVRTFVPTESQRDKLKLWGMKNLVTWSRGVDTQLFKPAPKMPLEGDHPIIMYMGRVAVEKSIEEFLKINTIATKYVVGDGPDLTMLKKRYPDTHFVGFKFGEELASYLAAADVFVFPSKTDTFGLVLLEAMACGVPVAAYPVTGPIDIIQNGVTGILDDNLEIAVNQALELKNPPCREFALAHSWAACTQTFAHHLVNNHQTEQACESRAEQVTAES